MSSSTIDSNPHLQNRDNLPANRVLVTGGAGFLGSNLCERLLRDGHEVICLDNFYTGRKENVAHLLDNPAFELMRHDVVEPLNLEVDRIFNLACPASPVHYQYDPVKTMRTSVLGALNVLELARRVGARVLQASTSEIYGDPDPKMHPQPESYWGNVNTIGVRSCYDEGKRASETLFMDYHRQYGVDTAIVRIFNTYGPRMLANDGRVVSNFIFQALSGQPLTIYGDGKQTRSFCYVDDLVDAMVCTMKERDFPGPVNIGNPEEFTILELAEKVLKLTGNPSELIREPLPPDDPKMRRPDIERARTRLGWEPTTSLDEGLVLTVEYFKKQLSGD